MVKQCFIVSNFSRRREKEEKSLLEFKTIFDKVSFNKVHSLIFEIKFHSASLDKINREQENSVMNFLFANFLGSHRVKC